MVFNHLQKLKSILDFNSTLRNISVCIAYVKSRPPQIWAFCQGMGRFTAIRQLQDQAQHEPTHWDLGHQGLPVLLHHTSGRDWMPQGELKWCFWDSGAEGMGRCSKWGWSESFLHSKSSLFSPLHLQMYYMSSNNCSSFWYLVRKSISIVFLLLLVLSFSQNVRVLCCVSVLIIRRYIQEVRAK